MVDTTKQANSDWADGKKGVGLAANDFLGPSSSPCGKELLTRSWVTHLFFFSFLRRGAEKKKQAADNAIFLLRSSMECCDLYRLEEKRAAAPLFLLWL